MDIPQLSEDDLKEIEELADERQLEIELEQELEQYAIEQILKEEDNE